MGTYHSSYIKNCPLLKLFIKNQDSNLKIAFQCQAIFDTPTEMILFKKEVMVMPLEKQNIDLLIGVDLISKGNFYINNGYFSFEIPREL